MPLTPTISVEGRKPLYHRDLPFLKFGAVCMVYSDKINQQAKILGMSAGAVPKAEPGVCMGEDPSHRGSYLFIVANGEVVPRRVIRKVNVHPWDWKHKYSPTAILLVPRAPKYNHNVQNVENFNFGYFPASSSGNFSQMPVSHGHILPAPVQFTDGSLPGSVL